MTADQAREMARVARERITKEEELRKAKERKDWIDTHLDLAHATIIAEAGKGRQDAKLDVLGVPPPQESVIQDIMDSLCNDGYKVQEFKGSAMNYAENKRQRYHYLIISW